ncbi:MAG TPA: serine hydrolase domain-containing protein, partial [Caulobacteraceae bacterium]|nr:serine hydrolase domain-containing protein [Caulobacteraceae bacterium]
MTNMATMDRRALMAFMAAMAVPGSALARAVTSGDLTNVKAMMDKYVGGKILPGMVYGVRRLGEPPAYLSEGTLDFDTPIKCAPNSIFRVYSMTKPTIGVAAMQLIEQKKIKLDTPVADILPEFKNMRVLNNPGPGGSLTDTRPATKPILIKHLLTHTAGLSYSIGRGPLAEAYIKEGITPGSRDRGKAPGANQAAVTNLKEFSERLSKMPLNREPGTAWEYAVGIDLMGYIIQVIEKKPLWQYMQEHVFRPLKMVDTDFIVPKDKVDRFASVYATQNGKQVKVDDRLNSPFTRDRDLPSGGGGLVSTAVDYLRFTTALVNQGSLDGARILKPDSVELMRTNLMPGGVFFGGRNGYGAAVAVVLPGGERPGGEPASSYWWFGIAGTQMWIDPLNKLSAVLMIQQNPTTVPVQQEVRVATYKDLATVPKGKA